MLHNLKFDERVASYSNASGVGAKESILADSTAAKGGSSGACTAITFRTGELSLPLCMTTSRGTEV